MADPATPSSMPPPPAPAAATSSPAASAQGDEDSQQHPASFYQPGTGNIFSFFAQGTLTPPPSSSFSFLMSSTKKSGVKGTPGDLLFSPAASSSVKSINLDSLPTPVPSRKSLAAYLDLQTPEKRRTESLLSPAGTPQAPAAATTTTAAQARAGGRGPSSPSSPTFVFAAHDGPDADAAVEEGKGGGHAHHHPSSSSPSSMPTPGSSGKKNKKKHPNQERFEQTSLHRRLSKGQQARQDQLNEYRQQKGQGGQRRASTGGALNLSTSSVNTSLTGRDTALFSSLAARRRSLQLEEQRKKEMADRRKANAAVARAKPDKKRICNSARRPLRPLSAGQSSNRRASAPTDQKENRSVNLSNVSSSGYLNKPNALKAKKPPVTDDGLFTLNFSPPPKRVEDTTVYNFQEESSSRTFMRNGGRRRSSMFGLEFSPPGRPGLTGRKKRPSLEVEEEEEEDDESELEEEEPVEGQDEEEEEVQEAEKEEEEAAPAFSPVAEEIDLEEGRGVSFDEAELQQQQQQQDKSPAASASPSSPPPSMPAPEPSSSLSPSVVVEIGDLQDAVSAASAEKQAEKEHSSSSSPVADVAAALNGVTLSPAVAPPTTTSTTPSPAPAAMRTPGSSSSAVPPPSSSSSVPAFSMGSSGKKTPVPTSATKATEEEKKQPQPPRAQTPLELPPLPITPSSTFKAQGPAPSTSSSSSSHPNTSVHRTPIFAAMPPVPPPFSSSARKPGATLGSGMKSPISPSRTQLMAALDDLIKVEHEKRELAEKLLEVDEKAQALEAALNKETNEVVAARAAVEASKAVCMEKEALVVELRARVEETKAQLAALESLPQTVQETTQVLEATQAQVVEKEAAVAALQQQLEEAQGQLAALQDLPHSIQESAAALASAQALCVEKEKLVEHLSTQLGEAKAKISTLETLPQSVAESQQALAASQALCQEKGAMVEHLREQVQEQRTRLVTLEQEMPAELAQTKTALATAQALCTEKDSHVQELKALVGQREARLVELEGMPSLVQQTKVALEAALAQGDEKDAMLAALQAELAALQAQLAAALNQKPPTPIKEKVIVEVASPATLQALADAEALVAEKEAQVVDLQGRLEETMASLARLEGLPAQLQATQAALATSEARCEQAGALMDTLQEQVEEAMGKVAALEEENASLLATQAKLQQQVSDAQGQAREAIKEAATSAAAAVAAASAQQQQQQTAAPVDLGSLLSESQMAFLNGAQSRVSELEKLLVDRQVKADTDKARLEEEVEAQRVERRALEDALNTFFMAGGLRGLAPKELATANAGREAAIESRAEALRQLVEEKRAATQQVREHGEETARALASKGKELAVVQGRLEEKQAEVASLKEQLAVEQDAVHALMTSLEKKEGELKGWKEQVKRKGQENEEIQTLMARLEKEEAEVCQLDGLVQEKEKEVAALQRALKEKEGARQALAAKVEEGEGEVATLTTKWEAAEREVRTLRRAREEADRQIEALGESLASKEKECTSLRGRLTAQADTAAQASALQDVQVQVKALTATLEKKNSEMGALKEKLLAAEEARTVAREEVAGQVEGLQQSLQEKEHELNGLMDRLMAAQEYREEMQEKLRQVTEEKAKAEAATAQLKEEERMRQENVQRLLEDKEHVEERLRRFEADRDAATAAVAQASAERTVVAQQAESAQEYVTRLEAKCEALHSEVEKETAEKRRLEAVNEALTVQVQDKEKEVESLSRKLVLAKDLAASLEEELQAKTMALGRDLGSSSSFSSSRPTTRAAASSSNNRAAAAAASAAVAAPAGSTQAELARERDLREAMELHMLDARDAAHALEADKVRLLAEMEEHKRRAAHLERQNVEMARSLSRMEEDCERADMVRKALHNQLVEAKGNIQVFVRVRPPLSGEGKVKSLPFKFVDSGVGVGPAGERYCRALELTGMEEGEKGHRFSYDQVFTPRASQEAVFSEVLPLVQSALDGYKVCVFAYGQTGSGKTYTMLGPEGGRVHDHHHHHHHHRSKAAFANEERGIVYRSVEHVFGAVAALRKHGWRFGLSVEMVEIYNENLRDLLASSEDGGGDYCFERSSGGGHKGGFGSFAASTGSDYDKPLGMGKSKRRSKRLEVKHVFGASSSAASGGETTVPGLTSLPVHSASEVTALVSQALSRRCTKRTRSNADSSRSHVVFTLKIEAESSRGIVRHGCLHLIDLAGSERMAKSGSNEHPELLREAQSINKSLSVLGNVMTALHKKEKHVPFRESALTSLLRHSLGGDCKALMVCNVSPSPASMQESVCSLRFAQKVNAVVTHKK